MIISWGGQAGSKICAFTSAWHWLSYKQRRIVRWDRGRGLSSSLLRSLPRYVLQKRRTFWRKRNVAKQWKTMCVSNEMFLGHLVLCAIVSFGKSSAFLRLWHPNRSTEGQEFSNVEVHRFCVLLLLDWSLNSCFDEPMNLESQCPRLTLGRYSARYYLLFYSSRNDKHLLV